MTHAHSTHFRWLAIPVGILLVLGIIWASNHRKAGDAPVPNTSTGELALIAEAIDPVGTVTMIRNNEEQAVTSHMPLQEGDIVRTTEGSVSLEFFAGSRVALDEHTELTITNADLDTENPRIQQVGITLHTGRIWNRILKLLDADARFDVRGTALTATVRGTAFAMTSSPTTGEKADETLDLVEGRLTVAIIDGEEGILEPGFTLMHGVTTEERPFAAHIVPTPDSVRNDAFIRAQLAADNAFIERVRTMRQELGDTETYEAVGNEAGPFTLTGGEHSNYQYLELKSSQPLTSALTPGESIALTAEAIFNNTGALTRQDVSRSATWQLSDTSLATISDSGTLTAKNGIGTVIVVARWNDGTHEHSSSIRVPIGETTVDTASTIRIR